MSDVRNLGGGQVFYSCTCLCRAGLCLQVSKLAGDTVGNRIWVLVMVSLKLKPRVLQNGFHIQCSLRRVPGFPWGD